MLHLAIIHEEEVIAQQLIQLFPKEVLDIQNNLYQVSVDIVAFLHASTELLLLLISSLPPKTPRPLPSRDPPTPTPPLSRKSLSAVAHQGL